jgi:hypothetical protein
MQGALRDTVSVASLDSFELKLTGDELKRRGA